MFSDGYIFIENKQHQISMDNSFQLHKKLCRNTGRSAKFILRVYKKPKQKKQAKMIK